MKLQKWIIFLQSLLKINDKISLCFVSRKMFQTQNYDGSYDSDKTIVISNIHLTILTQGYFNKSTVITNIHLTKKKNLEYLIHHESFFSIYIHFKITETFIHNLKEKWKRITKPSLQLRKQKWGCKRKRKSWCWWHMKWYSKRKKKTKQKKTERQNQGKGLWSIGAETEVVRLGYSCVGMDTTRTKVEVNKKQQDM